MIFRQLFDSVSGTYSYLLASRPGGEALILDPVLEKADRYCKLLQELNLKLVKAVFSKVPTCSAPAFTFTASAFQSVKALTGPADHERQELQ